MTARRPTRSELDAAAAVAAHGERVSAQAEAALRRLLALVIGILLTLALIHWMTPCEGVALCMTAAIRPLRPAGDGRIRPLPIPPAERALREAARQGWDDGERAGYVAGWRWGAVCGGVAGWMLGMLCCWALVQLGRMVGAGA